MSSNKRPQSPSAPNPSKRPNTTPTYPSYLTTPNLPPKIRLFCEILTHHPPSLPLEPSLNATAVAITTYDVEDILKLSYSNPTSAVSFFRWAGTTHLQNRHSPYSWNLVVDILGKNKLFDAMWGAVKSMRSQGLLSLSTYASVFSSLAAAGRIDDALSAFDKMPLHGVEKNTAALNSLLSALCREACVAQARAVFRTLTVNLRPDADSFAILLEGCENEGAFLNARQVFDEMITCVGWDPGNVPAYDSVLVTVLRAGGQLDGTEALGLLELMRANLCSPGIKSFRAAMEFFAKKKDAGRLFTVWEILMAQNRCLPDAFMYNLMIEMQCNLQHTDLAMRLLDEMVGYGAFPNSRSYNLLLLAFMKRKKTREAVSLFYEMVKNECEPTYDNCLFLLGLLLDAGMSELALKVWRCMVENELPHLEDCGNLLVLRLNDLDKLSEACKYAEDMIDRGIKLNSSTLSVLRHSLQRVGKEIIHENLLRKWKSR